MITSLPTFWFVSIVFRKVCCNIPESKKAQPAAFFPPGWTFFFDLTKSSYLDKSNLEGLVIRDPYGRRYSSVESAMEHNPSSIGKLKPSPLHFYDHVGIDHQKFMGLKTPARNSSIRSSAESRKRASNRERDDNARKRKKTEIHLNGKLEPTIHGSTRPSDLIQLRCGECYMCAREDCKRCETCVINASRSRRTKEACLRHVSELCWLEFTKFASCNLNDFFFSF